MKWIRKLKNSAEMNSKLIQLKAHWIRIRNEKPNKNLSWRSSWRRRRIESAEILNSNSNVMPNKNLSWRSSWRRRRILNNQLQLKNQLKKKKNSEEAAHTWRKFSFFWFFSFFLGRDQESCHLIRQQFSCARTSGLSERARCTCRSTHTRAHIYLKCARTWTRTWAGKGN